MGSTLAAREVVAARDAMLISLIVALADNRVIGRDNTLPWHLPDDLRRFKALTLGKPILMGRKTFESIGKPLPNRRNLVLTRSKSWQASGAEVVHTMEAAIAGAADAPELAVIGGEEVFRLALPHAQRVYLTEVHGLIDGNTFFPPLDGARWRQIERSEHPADAHHAYAMSFLTLERC